MTLGIYIKQSPIITLMVFNKILFTITVGFKIFPFNMSIILTSFNYNTLAIIITPTIFSTYSFNYLI